MEVISEIARARKYGAVRCGCVGGKFTDPAEIATRFALNLPCESREEIAARDATRLATIVLYKDLAYSCEIMAWEDARRLASRFLSLFDSETPKFYTDSTLYQTYDDEGQRIKGGYVGGGATDIATFDAGVIVLGTNISGCLWVEDED